MEELREKKDGIPASVWSRKSLTLKKRGSASRREKIKRLSCTRLLRWLPAPIHWGFLRQLQGRRIWLYLSADRDAAGYSTTLPNGGTPLFSALQFRRDWYNPFHSRPRYMKGGDTAFEEPIFGEE